MSIFEKPVSQLTTLDVAELLDHAAVENVRLEFKRDIPNKDDTLKKLSSFANTFGGFMVVGAEANSADGRIIALPGVDVSPSYKQTIVQWCFGGVSPPMNVEVSDPIPVPGGRFCYVLSTNESDLAPHFLNGRKGLYVRTDEFSARFEARLATENELRHLLDRKDLIRKRRTSLIERARQRFQTFTEHRYRESTIEGTVQSDVSIGARYSLTIMPRFPSLATCDHPGLVKIVSSQSIPWRGTEFPQNHGNLISQHESVITLKAGSGFSMVEANIWGMLFFATEIEERREFAGIHLNQFLGNLLAFVKYATQVLAQLRYAGSLHIDMQMDGIRGINWIYFPHGFPDSGPCSVLDDVIHFSLEASTDELSAGPDSLAINILRLVFFATNWLGLADSEEKLKNIVLAGYEFNNWQRPT